jgi:hypothetical protein
MYSKESFLRIQDYIAEGCKGTLSEEDQENEDLLFTAAGMNRREGRHVAMAWLMSDRGYSRYKAQQIVEDAVNLFYGSDNIRKETWRNLLFEKLLSVAQLWERDHITRDIETGEYSISANAKDYEAYAKLMKQAAIIKRLDQPDDKAPTNNVGTMNVIMFGTDPRRADIPYTDKKAIQQLDYLQQLPKTHQERFAMELGQKPFDIDTVMDNSISIAHEVTGDE